MLAIAAGILCSSLYLQCTHYGLIRLASVIGMEVLCCLCSYSLSLSFALFSEMDCYIPLHWFNLMIECRGNQWQ